MASGSQRNVFVNCPFDKDYAINFRSILFSVIACGFNVRCAREMSDASQTRIDKIYTLIDRSRFSVHDLSRTELDEVNMLPRFNMPLELGIFLGAKRYGNQEHQDKRCLVLDIDEFRYQKFISDLAGIDITDHGGDPRRIVGRIRDWLVTVSRRKTVPPTNRILAEYDAFEVALPSMATDNDLPLDDLAYADLERLIIAWVRQGPKLSAK